MIKSRVKKKNWIKTDLEIGGSCGLHQPLAILDTGKIGTRLYHDLGNFLLSV